MATPNTGAAGSNDPTATRRQTKRPKYSKFTQQELPACKPILTPRAVISAFLIVTVVFIPIGVASLIASRDVVEIVDRYDSQCIPGNVTDKVAYIQSSEDKTCNRELHVEKRMKSPIYVYYQLDNFYQNHRRYADLLLPMHHTLLLSITDKDLMDFSSVNLDNYSFSFLFPYHNCLHFLFSDKFHLFIVIHAVEMYLSYRLNWGPMRWGRYMDWWAPLTMGSMTIVLLIHVIYGFNKALGLLLTNTTHVF